MGELFIKICILLIPSIALLSIEQSFLRYPVGIGAGLALTIFFYASISNEKEIIETIKDFKDPELIENYGRGDNVETRGTIIRMNWISIFVVWIALIVSIFISTQV